MPAAEKPVVRFALLPGGLFVTQELPGEQATVTRETFLPGDPAQIVAAFCDALGHAQPIVTLTADQKLTAAELSVAMAFVAPVLTWPEVLRNGMDRLFTRQLLGASSHVPALHPRLRKHVDRLLSMPLFPF